MMYTVDNQTNDSCKYFLEEIGKSCESDTLLVMSPILNGLDTLIEKSLSAKKTRKDKLTVVIDTLGGLPGVVERIVNSIRNRYKFVDVVIPDKAMSAGTLFVLSADEIFMRSYSVLGPIDPQIPKDDNSLTPALGYVEKFNEFKSLTRPLTEAEIYLLDKIDLADLYTYEEYISLSEELIEKWLCTYKFKYWTLTENRKKKVTSRMKSVRAKKIAQELNNTKRWHFHGRGINRETLSKELGLRVNELEKYEILHHYSVTITELVSDYMRKTSAPMFVKYELNQAGGENA